MTREEIIRNLKYTMKKHENDRVGTFETNISLMCKDILDYLEQEPCGDTIIQADRLIDLANAIESDDSGYWTNKRISSALRNISFHCIVKKFPPVTQKSSENIPCITPEEMQKCKAIVKKYIPKQEPCEDCISRQYLLNNCVVDKVTMPYVSVNKIKNAPPITPQQKIGRWINIDDIESECSECGHREPNERFIFEDINFCAKCGTKMESEEEE